MSVKSGQAVTVLFATSDPTTGAAAAASVLPTGTLYISGTVDAAVVTVASVATGVYKASVTLPTLAAGDLAALRIAATVGGVAAEGVVWQDVADTKRVSDLNDVAAGAEMTLTAAYDAAKSAATQASVDAVKLDTAATLADTGTDGVVVATASKTGYALSAAGVAAIWAALTSALTTVGSVGKYLVDYLAGVKAKTDLLSSASVTFAAPVSADGETITLVSGDDYYAADGRQLEWTDDGTWPTLTGATIVMTIRTRAGVLHTLDAELTAEAPSTQVIQVEVPAATTGALGVGTGLRWDVEATLATSEHIVTLMRGSATVLEAYTPVAGS